MNCDGSSSDSIPAASGSMTGLRNYLSIVVATRNREASLASCLESLRKCHTPCGMEVEVVIADNGSTDGTRQMIKDLAKSSARLDFHYVHEPRPGKSYAVNAGVALARGSIIAFVDDDVVVDSGWLNALCEEFDRDPTLGLIAGRVETARSANTEVAVTRSAVEKILNPQETLDGLILGCNLAVRRDVFDRVAGRDTRLGPGRGLSCEDIDFVYRVLKAGFRGRFSPRAVVFHAPGLRNRGTEYLRGWGAFYLKYVLRGDPWIARKAWWEIRRILSDLLKRPVTGPINELSQMFIGALIMAPRLGLSLFTRDL